MICAAIGYPDSCALLEINVRRKGMDLLFEREGIFRVRTGEGSRCVHAIASFHFLYSFADRFNDTSAIRSESVGKRRLHGISARAHIGVIGIDPGRMNAHQHLTR